jgi:hypothetical protein
MQKSKWPLSACFLSSGLQVCLRLFNQDILYITGEGLRNALDSIRHSQKFPEHRHFYPWIFVHIFLLCVCVCVCVCVCARTSNQCTGLGCNNQKLTKYCILQNSPVCQYWNVNLLFSATLASLSHLLLSSLHKAIWMQVTFSPSVFSHSQILNILSLPYENIHSYCSL